MKFLFLMLIYSYSSFASYENPQEALELPPEDKRPSMEDVIINKPEKYQKHETVINELNTSLGIKDKRQYTGRDNSQFDLAYHGSARPGEISKLSSFEASYMRRTKNYSQIWWGGMIKITKAPFSLVSDNQKANATDDVNDESQFQRPESANSNITTFGFGAGYRFKLLLDFKKTKDIFEQVNAFATYNQWNESFIGKAYKGYGLTTDYLIYKRSSTSFLYGLKYSYNFALMERSAIASEKAQDRSLVLSYSSLAFEIGYVFE
jgi:hypothetical protein